MRKNAEPAKRVFAFEDGKRMGRDRGAADAVETIASGNEVAADSMGSTGVLECDSR